MPATIKQCGDAGVPSRTFEATPIRSALQNPFEQSEVSPVSRDARNLRLFDLGDETPVQPIAPESTDTRERLRRLDTEHEFRAELLKLCRLRPGDVWDDSIHGHKVGVLDASNTEDTNRLVKSEPATLVLGDPPYNVVVGNSNTPNLFKVNLDRYLQFSRAWVHNAARMMARDASLYVWIGADYRDGFQPFADFIILMRDFADLRPRNIITMRNQRGYGTQLNWMWVRQELLYYTRGRPPFDVSAEYTDIPKILRGYYKEIQGKRTENLERSKSDCIRAGNVWVDVQQVFYRMEENVPGCYAQKPLKAVERILRSATSDGDLVVDLFAHSGTTLLAGERLGRKVYTCDIDPIFAEITIRRLEHFRDTGRTGWQWRNPFPELDSSRGSGRWI